MVGDIHTIPTSIKFMSKKYSIPYFWLKMKLIRFDTMLHHYQIIRFSNQIPLLMVLQFFQNIEKLADISSS